MSTEAEIEAAAEVLWNRDRRGDEPAWGAAPDDHASRPRYREDARQMLAAVEPLIRERLAQKVEADRDAYCNPKGLYRAFVRHGGIPVAWQWMTRSARIVRGDA